MKIGDTVLVKDMQEKGKIVDVVDYGDFNIFTVEVVKTRLRIENEMEKLDA